MSKQLTALRRIKENAFCNDNLFSRAGLSGARQRAAMWTIESLLEDAANRLSGFVLFATRVASSGPSCAVGIFHENFDPSRLRANIRLSSDLHNKAFVYFFLPFSVRRERLLSYKPRVSLRNRRSLTIARHRRDLSSTEGFLSGISAIGNLRLQTATWSVGQAIMDNPNISEALVSSRFSGHLSADFYIEKMKDQMDLVHSTVPE